MWPSSSCTFHQLCSKRMHLRAEKDWIMLDRSMSGSRHLQNKWVQWGMASWLWVMAPWYPASNTFKHQKQHGRTKMDQGAALSFGGELGQRGEVSKNLGPMGTKLWQTFSNHLWFFMENRWKLSHWKIESSHLSAWHFIEIIWSPEMLTMFPSICSGPTWNPSKGPRTGGLGWNLCDQLQSANLNLPTSLNHA